MSGVFWRPLFAFVFPGGLVLLAALGFLRPTGLPAWLQPPVSAIPFFVLAFGLVFGWFLSSARLLLSLLILALTDRALSMVPMTGHEAASINETIFAVTAFLLPLNMLALSILKADAVSILRAAGYVVFVLAQSILVLWLCYPEQLDIVSALQQTSFKWFTTVWTPVPQPALVAFAVAGMMHLARYVLHRDPLEAGSFWALAAAFAAFHGERYGWYPTGFFASGGLILILSLLQSAHHRTHRDELTGIGGRLAYDEAIGQVGGKFSLAVLAVDQLRSYANVHGKSVGEQILRVVAPKVQAACRGGLVFRVSGEELTLLFPDRSAVETLAALETVRKIVETTSLVLRGRDRVREEVRDRNHRRSKDHLLPVTVSAGVAEKINDAATISLVLKAAYRALYEAKSTGGNVVRRAIATADPVRRPSGTSGRIVPSGEYS